MIQRHNRLDATAIVVMTLCCACWGVNQVAIKVAIAGFSPLFGAGLRGVIAAALVLLWSRLRGVELFRRDGTLPAGILIGTLFAVEFGFLYWGLVYTTASRSIIFMYLAPFVVAIGAHLWIPGEHLSMRQVVGLVSAFAGMAVAFGDALRLPSAHELLGDLMVIAAAILWGATTVVVKVSRLAQVAPSKTLLYQLVGSIVLLPVSFLVGEAGVTQPHWPAFLALFYQAIIVAFVTYLAWFWLMTHYPASRLSAFSFLAPLLGVLAGGLLLGEAVTPALWIALILVAFGIYLVNRRSRLAASGEIATDGEPA